VAVACKLIDDSKMKETLLTTGEIEKISTKAKYSILNNPGFVGQFTKFKTDIFSISPNKKLIFIQGDNFTGLQHINMRHRFYTNAHSKISENEFVATSRFPKDSGTLFDYQKISESVYNPENMDSKNNNPELFDVYKGKVDETEYRLILYKDTKIVHTLFPVERKKPKKKFEKTDIVAQWHDLVTLLAVIPYFDSNQVLRYGIGVTLYTNEKTEKWDILIYENGKVVKNVELGKQKVNYQFDIGTRIQQINYADVSKLEAIIYKIENGEIK
jgi:hypothetical protein